MIEVIAVILDTIPATTLAGLLALAWLAIGTQLMFWRDDNDDTYTKHPVQVMKTVFAWPYAVYEMTMHANNTNTVNTHAHTHVNDEGVPLGEDVHDRAHTEHRHDRGEQTRRSHPRVNENGYVIERVERVYVNDQHQQPPREHEHANAHPDDVYTPAPTAHSHEHSR